MAFTRRSQRLGYDYISAGNAAGLEFNEQGIAPRETTQLTLDKRGTSTSALSQNMPERLIPGTDSQTSDTSKFREVVG